MNIYIFDLSQRYVILATPVRRRVIHDFAHNLSELRLCPNSTRPDTEKSRRRGLLRPPPKIREWSSPPPLLSRFLRSHDINLRVSDVFNHIKRSKRICRQQRQLKVNVNRVFYAYTHTVGKTKTWLRVLGNISVKSCEAIVSKLARRNGDFVYSALKFMPISGRTLYSSYRFPHARQAHMR